MGKTIQYHHKSIFTSGLIFLVSSLLWSGNSQAQSSSAVTDSLELDRIIVTASKIPQPQRETTKPVIVIDRLDIERNSGRDLAQLLNQQSGIRVNESYGTPSGNRTLYMQGASAQYTLVLIDGLAVNDPSGVGGVLDLRLIPLDNIERVEVIKGSQSTLYGTDAIAGVINIITKEGSGKPIGATGQLSYGSFNTLQGSIGLNGAVSNDRVRYSVNYKNESSDGFSAARDPDETGDFGDDGFNSESFYAKINVSPIQHLTITPFLKTTSFSGDYDDGAFQDGDNFYHLTLVNPGLQIEYKNDHLSLNGGYNFTQSERSFESAFGFDEFEGQLHNADLFGSLSLSDCAQILTGINYQKTIIPERITASSQLSSQLTSPYATLLLKEFHGLHAELGYRLNSHSEYGNNSTFNIAPAYHLTDNVKLYASYGTGFKAPTLSELFGPFGSNPDLEPQISRSVNLGLETYLMDHSLKISAHYFDRNIDNLIIYTFTEGFINRDQQEDSGFELTANWLLHSSVTIGSYYNYIQGEIVTIDDSGLERRSDNLIRRPTHSFGLNATFNITENLHFRVDGEFNGERTDLFFNPANNFAQEEVKLDSYSLLNLYAEYRFWNNQLTIFADIRNLLNSDFTEVYGFNTSGFNMKGGLRLSI